MQSQKLDYQVDFDAGFIDVYDSTSRILLEKIQFSIHDDKLDCDADLPAYVLGLIVTGYPNWIRRRNFLSSNSGLVTALSLDLNDFGARNFNAFDGTKGQ